MSHIASYSPTLDTSFVFQPLHVFAEKRKHLFIKNVFISILLHHPSWLFICLVKYRSHQGYSVSNVHDHRNRSFIHVCCFPQCNCKKKERKKKKALRLLLPVWYHCPFWSIIVQRRAATFTSSTLTAMCKYTQVHSLHTLTDTQTKFIFTRSLLLYALLTLSDHSCCKHLKFVQWRKKA